MSYKTLYLTNKMRSKLKEPFGRVFKNGDGGLEKLLSERKGRLITVGDEVSRRFDADIKIFDGRTKRNTVVEVPEYDCKLFNPPATIQKKAFEILEKVYASEEKCSIFVEGEEDLLVIPSIYLADDDDIVLYGLFDVGVGAVEINHMTKESVGKIINGFRDSKYSEVVIGGTFDRLHKGHKYVLSMCRHYADKTLVGVASDRMAMKKDSRIDSFEKRSGNVDKILKSSGSNYKIVDIDDCYGPAIVEGDAIIVTEETLRGAERINDKRRSLGYGELEIIVLPYVLDDVGRKLSSSYIRDRE